MWCLFTVAHNKTFQIFLTEADLENMYLKLFIYFV
jgi:hypothetical protein